MVRKENLPKCFTEFKLIETKIGKRKVHYTFEDKTEMAEDYNLQTNELLSKYLKFNLKKMHLYLNSNLKLSEKMEKEEYFGRLFTLGV